MATKTVSRTAPQPAPAKKAPRRKPSAKSAPTSQAPAEEAVAAPVEIVAEKPLAEPSATSGTKAKLVRDSFTMPADDFAAIARLKTRALGLMRPAKKSELLRAGLHALEALTDKKLLAALDALVPLKPGRKPK